METTAPPRYRDSITAALGTLASEWESQHRAYQAATLRALHIADPGLRETIEQTAAGTLAIRDSIGKRMSALMRKHPLHGWMARHRGFPKAVHTARLLSLIGDPLRFPGRACENHHHLPSDYEGDTCPMLIYGDNGSDPAVCGAVVGPERRGTGVRSLWHYCGVHVVDGKLPKQRRGHQGTWNPAARDCLLKPDVGLAAQLIRACGGVQPWRGVYDEAKERITRERGAECPTGSETRCGPSPAPSSSSGAEGRHEIAALNGSAAVSSSEGEGTTVRSPALRPIEVEKRARVIAVKAMLGDLLTEWKRQCLR